MAEFLMPTLGSDMDFGTLLEWRVKPGDTVRRGDIVAVIDTTKAEIEVEIFQDGVIEELLVGEGTRVPVGAPLARLRDSSERVPTAPSPTSSATPHTPLKTPSPAPLTSTRPPRARISPLARRTAEQLGVDPLTLTGSGPAGAVVRADVQRAALAHHAEPAHSPAVQPVGRDGQREREIVPRSTSMNAIGELMSRSKREIPHYYLQTQIDMTNALEWISQQNERLEVSRRLLPAALLLCASARAAAATPAMNGFWLTDAFHPAQSVHLGVAISLRGGALITPALRDADRMSVFELMDNLSDLVRRARAGRLRSSQMSDPTITVTNLGEQGAETVHGVIYPPQVALVGFGGILERPWASAGMVGARRIVKVSVAADHRVSHGHTASQFLAHIEKSLQRPQEL